MSDEEQQEHRDADADHGVSQDEHNQEHVHDEGHSSHDNSDQEAQADDDHDDDEEDGEAVVAGTRPSVGLPSVRKTDLIERVVAATELKRRVVKPVVESTLAELGKSIAAGEQLYLEPFGKLTVKSEKPVNNGRIYVTRVRRKEGDDA